MRRKIEWNKVTWYSKLLAIVVFCATFYIAFMLGEQAQEIQDHSLIMTTISKSPSELTTEKKIASAVFLCEDYKSIKATFYEHSVDLMLNDGRHLVVPQAISASGARYANANESFVFWNKGRTAFIQEKNEETFVNCTEQ